MKRMSTFIDRKQASFTVSPPRWQPVANDNRKTENNQGGRKNSPLTASQLFGRFVSEAPPNGHSCLTGIKQRSCRGGGHWLYYIFTVFVTCNSIS